MSRISCRLGVCLSLILFTYLLYCGLIAFVSCRIILVFVDIPTANPQET